jgi:thiol-disulfide isomerase/thioredoxin
MKRLITTLVISALLLTGCGSGGLSKASEKSFVAGSGAAVVIKAADRQSAPGISGETLDGSTYTMDKSKVTVINIWASWCAPCRAEAPIFQDFATKNPDIKFLGILTRDNVSAARSFTERFKITYPTLVDDSLILKFRGSLTPNAIPTTLILDSKGRIAARISGATTVAGLRKVLEEVIGAPLHG